MLPTKSAPAAWSGTGATLLFLTLAINGCAARPTPEVLAPVSERSASLDQVTVLAVTNRQPLAGDKGFGHTWARKVIYGRYRFSLPKNRHGETISYPSRQFDPVHQYGVTEHETLNSSELVEAAGRLSGGDGTVAIFVHGYNNSFQEAIYRTAQLTADARTVGTVVLFSWPSAASVTGYVADRDAVLYSRSQLSRLIGTLAASPRIRRVMLFGHSMGGFLTMEAVRQLKLEGHAAGLSKVQIVLAAPDIDVDVFRSQLFDIGTLREPITILVSKRDEALALSGVLGGERPRVGRIDIDNPMVQEAAKSERLRIIDITSLHGPDRFGHDRYAALARFSGQLAKAERAQRASAANFGAFIFEAAGAVVESPLKLARGVSRR